MSWSTRASCRSSGMRRAALCAGMLAAAMALSAAAQGLFKSTMPDGRVVYGDKPAAGAAKVEEITPDTAKGGIGGGLTPGETQKLKDLERARAGREASGGAVQ